MKRLILAAALALSACNTIPSISPSPAVQVDLTKAEYAAEVAFNVAASAYVAAEPNMSPTIKSQAKAILGEILSCPAIVTASTPCTGYLQVARNAVAAGDATSLSAEVAQITTLAGEVTSLAKPK